MRTQSLSQPGRVPPHLNADRVKLLPFPILHHLQIPERKRETSSFEHLNERATCRTHVLEEILSRSQDKRLG